jgi:hypothetical protein
MKASKYTLLLGEKERKKN